MKFDLEYILGNYKKISIWGAGLTGLEVYNFFKEIDFEIDFIIDSKVIRNDKFGIPIISPVHLNEYNLDEVFIFVSSNAYDNEIVSQINALGKYEGYEIFSVCPKEIHEKTVETLALEPDLYKSIGNMLEDVDSQKTLSKLIEYRITLNQELINEIYTGNQYFQPFMKEIYEGFIDCGAYDGDTIKSFLDYQKSYYNNIYAIEPDCENVEKLKNKYTNIDIFNIAAWDKEEELNFDLNGSASGKVVEDSRVNNVKGKKLDTILLDKKVDLIKMDIEGAEMQALIGCQQLIEIQQPDLAICVYHKVEDLLEIPLFIKKLCPNYKFYLRHHSRGHGETVFYAINSRTS